MTWPVSGSHLAEIELSPSWPISVVKDSMTTLPSTSAQHVARRDDVGAEPLVDRQDVHGAGQRVTVDDRPVELELLVDLDDLHGFQADVDVLEEVPLDHHREDRHESRRGDEGVVAHRGGGGLVVSRPGHRPSRPLRTGGSARGPRRRCRGTSRPCPGYRPSVPCPTPTSQSRPRGRRSSFPPSWPTGRWSPTSSLAQRISHDH